MFRLCTSLPNRLATTLTALGLLLAPLPGSAEATLNVGTGGANASLDFRIVIPPVMRVIETVSYTHLTLPTSDLV